MPEKVAKLIDGVDELNFDDKYDEDWVGLSNAAKALWDSLFKGLEWTRGTWKCLYHYFDEKSLSSSEDTQHTNTRSRLANLI